MISVRDSIRFFSDNIPKLRDHLFNIFNYVYEHSPINFRTLTGMHHPSIPRLKGHIIYGRAKQIFNEGADGLANQLKLLSAMAANIKENPRGMAYCSMMVYPSTLITRPTDIAQVLLYNEDKVFRGIPAFKEIFGAHNLFALQQDKEWRQKRTKLMESILSAQALEGLVKPMQDIIDEFVDKLKKNGAVKSLEAFLVSLTMEVFAQTRLGSGPLNESANEISDGLGKAIDAASTPMKNVMVKLIGISEYARKAYQPVLNIDQEDTKSTFGYQKLSHL